MAVLLNPYTPGEVPRVLAGREHELQRLRDRFARVEVYGEYGGPLIVFHAPRGLGKTSLLRETQQTAAVPQGFVTAWISCAVGEPMLPLLVRAVERGLEETDSVPSDAWRPRLAKLGLEIGVPGVKVSADWVDPNRDLNGVPTGTDDPPPTRTGPASVPQAVVEDLLHSAARVVRDHGGAGLAVFVDELHAAPQADLAVLLNVLQTLNGDRDANPIVVVGAGLPSTPALLTRAATFGERSTFVALDRLAEEDAAYAVTEPAAELGVGWTDVAVAQVVAAADGYPYFLQLFAAATWDAGRPRTGSTLGERELAEGMRASGEQLRTMYLARWGAATPGEQRVVVAMAALGGGGEPVTRAAIAAHTGQTSRSLSDARGRLIEKGIIEPAGHGRLQFTIPGFAEFVTTVSEPPLPAGPS